MRSHWSQKPPPGVGVNLTHPLAIRLWDAWNFSEGAGNCTTGAVLGGRGVFMNGVLWGPEQAGLFDGVDDEVRIPNVLVGAGDFTMAVRVKFNSFPANTKIFADDNNGQPIRSLGSASNKAAFTLRDNSGQLIDLTGATTLVAGRWYWLIGVRRGSSAILYLDGRQDAAGTNASLQAVDTTTASWGIGRRIAATALPFSGLVSDALLWKGRALGASDALAFTRQPYSIYLPLRLTRSVFLVPQTLSAAVAQASLTAIAAALSPGAVTLNAAIAQFAVSALNAALTTGAVTVTLSPAQATLLGLPVTVTEVLIPDFVRLVGLVLTGDNLVGEII